MAYNAKPEPARIINNDEPLRHVLIVDDHILLAQSLCQILIDEELAVSVSVASTGDELMAEVSEAADRTLVLLDLSLSEELGNGLQLIPDLLAAGAVVVVLTGSTDAVTLGECFEAGAVGIIDKALPVERVVALVHTSLSGKPLDTNRRHDLLTDMRLARQRKYAAQAPFRALTNKECLVLEYLGDGLNAQEIAQAMFVSLSTVRTHVQSVLLKLGVHSQLAAVAMAHERQWLH